MRITTRLFITILFAFTLTAHAGIKKEYTQLKEATNQKIKVVESKLEKMGDRISELSGEAKDEMQVQYKELVAMKTKLQAELAEAGEVTEDKWEMAKDRVEDYADSLESKVDEAIN